MEANPFDWSDYLSAEGMADVAPFDFGLQGGQSGLNGRPEHRLEGDSGSVALKNSTTVGPGGTVNLEPLEAGVDPAPPQQTPDPVASSTKTGSAVSPQGLDDPRALVPDQVCTCAACLDGYHCPAHLTFPDANADCSPWIFGCRIAGCEWNTKDAAMHYIFTPLFNLLRHEKESFHYGKHGNYGCREADCKFTTKRFSDVKRHYSSKHCINPKTFECPAIGCKYHQQGFTRKDKLYSHYQKAHGGSSQPGKPNQPIKPKVGDRA